MELGLEVRQLAFGYGHIGVLLDVTLPTMRSGEVTAVVGPNAAGKSTLLKCIAGIHSAAGSVDLDGDAQTTDRTTASDRRNARWRRRRRHVFSDRILYTPQDPPPAVSISVFEAVLLARQGQLTGRASPAVLDEIGSVLAELHLDDLSARPISDLSGGQRQLVSIAQAMIRKPAVMLLD
ncbi:ATP-binding cassette domain-containing protein [Mycolicibacterium arenosum]|uniref:ABC transporter ATP-binding protein n=1 Tax=Mycolicibacterium arenosum TaxID=2952157 RepID=A0ABT1MFB1_9MYCO|nr:ABC transporter ATP-binding protein [Mycolicibacterium sp. CAU 1645]MCP9276899.1 ABC transporter ATP-binding protein [Mycolicibacterium sp. CAU 1645]